MNRSKFNLSKSLISDGNTSFLSQSQRGMRTPMKNSSAMMRTPAKSDKRGGREQAMATRVIDSSRVLDPRTIAQSLAFLNTGLTPEDILNPTKERIEVVYREFLIQVIQLRDQSLTQLPLNALSGDFDADMHRSSVPLTLLYRLMCSFFEDFGHVEFTITDIILPEKKRTRELLSFIVTYIRFYSAFKDGHDEVLGEQSGIAEAVKEAANRNAELEQEVVNTRKELDSRRRKENQLAEEKHKLSNELQSVIDQNNQVQKKMDAYEQGISDCTVKKEAFIMDAKHLDERNRYLAEEIIDNPDERTAEYEKQMEQINLLKQSLEDSIRELAELRSSEQQLGHTALVLKNFEETLRKLKEQKDKLDSTLLNHMHVVQDKEAAARDVSEMESQLEVAESRQIQAQRKHNEATKGHENELKKLNEKKMVLEKRRKHALTEQKDSGLNNAEILQAQKQLRHIQKLSSNVLRDGKCFIETCMEKYRMMLAAEREREAELRSLEREYKRTCQEAQESLNGEDILTELSTTFNRSSV